MVTLFQIVVPFLLGLVITFVISFSQAALITWVALLFGYIVFALQYKNTMTGQKRILVFLPSIAGMIVVVSISILAKWIPGL